ncbi:MAG: FHA domain-containing protein [Gammaproteobacteria bacterium]
MDDFDKLSLVELIRLQNDLSQAVTKRFQRDLALVMTDIVGSTAYFSRFGNETGLKLQQRHFDLLRRALSPYEGHIFSTAGDGALSYFPTAGQAVEAMIDLQNEIAKDNMIRERDHRLTVRAGVHFGPVLADGDFVTGDSVNLCARVAECVSAAEICVSYFAFSELPAERRSACRAQPAAVLKGIPEPVVTYLLDWRDMAACPVAIRFEATGEQINLPDLEVIRCGRLREQDGRLANDITLALSDPDLTQRISRWHFELLRGANHLYLRQVSDGITEVNGTAVRRMEQVPIKAGDVVRIGRVLSITFLAIAQQPENDATKYAATLLPQGYRDP